ncbi:MAG: hypothetical protein ABIQ93_08150 [Saprospiraceae bacterium]
MGTSKLIFAQTRLATPTDFFQVAALDATHQAIFQQKQNRVLGLWEALERARENARQTPTTEPAGDYLPAVIVVLDALEEAESHLKQLFPVILERV